jgi:hypothetical protein
MPDGTISAGRRYSLHAMNVHQSRHRRTHLSATATEPTAMVPAVGKVAAAPEDVGLSPAEALAERAGRELGAGPQPGQVIEAGPQPGGLGWEPSHKTVPASQQSAVQHGKDDSALVSSTYDQVLAAGGNAAGASLAAIQKLQELVEQRPGDTAYASTLIRESNSTIEKITATLAANASGKAFTSKDVDEDAIKNTALALSVVAASAGAVSTFTIARSLASKIVEHGSLENVDNGFNAARRQGYKELFRATYAALLADGKKDAARELKARGPIEAFEDVALDVAHDLHLGSSDAQVVGFVGDQANNVLHVEVNGAQVAVDVAQGTADSIDDMGQVSDRHVAQSVKFAANEGLRLHGGLLSRAHTLALDGIDHALKVGKRIADIKPGGSYALGGEIDIDAGASVALTAEVTVELDDNGKYTVSGEAGAQVGLSAIAGVDAGGAGAAEFEFDNAADAKKAALILAGAGATILGGEVLAPALLPHPQDLSFLKGHISSLEVTGTVGAEVDESFGVGPIDAEAGFRAEASLGFSVEFDDGKPSAMVRTTELHGEATLKAGVTFMRGEDSLWVGFVDGATEATLTVETSIPIDQAKVLDVAAFVLSPATAALDGPASTTLTLDVEGHLNDLGATATVTVEGLDGEEAHQVVGGLFKGEGKQAFDGLGATVSGEATTFDTREGGSGHFGIEFAGLGFDIQGHSQVTRIHESKSFEVKLGADKQAADAAPAAAPAD